MSAAPPVSPRRADARRSREKLLTAAAELLSRSPDTSVDVIAAHAGVGRTTAFRHFPTRPELLEATWMHLVLQTGAALAELDLGGRGPAEDLVLLVEAVTRLSERWPLLFRGARPALDSPDLQAAMAAPEALVGATVERAVAAGVLRPDLPAGLLIEMLFAAVQAVLLAGLRGDAASTAALSLLLDGTRGRSAP